MEGKDIPQADRLANIRSVLEAVAAGATRTRDIEGRTGISGRHVAYSLRAAQLLGLIASAGNLYEVSDAGRDLLGAPQGSAAELRGFRTAIASCPPLQCVAPDLLGDVPPSPEQIKQRILAQVDRMAPATAERRARTLLAWRKQTLDSTGPATYAFNANSIWVRSLEVQGYGSLKAVNVALRPFCVLVGRNATGKSLLLDSLTLISDCLSSGVPTALRRRASQLTELLWQGQAGDLAFAFEIQLPRQGQHAGCYDVARYEVGFGAGADGAAGTTWERLFLRPLQARAKSIHQTQALRAWRRVLSRSSAGVASYKGERKADRRTTEQKLSPASLALAELPQDDERFYLANRVRTLLLSGTQLLALQPDRLAQPCSVLASPALLTDGKNLAAVVKRLSEGDPGRFQEWIDHLQQALPEVEAVAVAEREADRHLYLELTYAGGLRIPMWRASAGTLRIIALTLLPFAAPRDAVFMVEEPENGIHPQALAAVHQALRSTRRTQIILASHCPVLIGRLQPEELLCFSHKAGQTEIIAGHQHPALQAWQPEVDLGSLFASNMLD